MVSLEFVGGYPSKNPYQQAFERQKGSALDQTVRFVHPSLRAPVEHPAPATRELKPEAGGGLKKPRITGLAAKGARFTMVAITMVGPVQAML